MKNYPIISTPLQIRILFSTKYRIITSKKLIYPLLFTYLLEITEVPVLHLIIAHEFSNFIIIYIHIYTDLHTVSIQINRVKEGCVLLASKGSQRSQRSYNITASVCVSRVHRLLGLSPELGQRVHFAEGTNLRCREDKKSPTDDDEERLATMDGSLPPILISHDDTRAEGCANGVKITNILYKVVEEKGVNIERRSAKGMKGV